MRGRTPAIELRMTEQTQPEQRGAEDRHHARNRHEEIAVIEQISRTAHSSDTGREHQPARTPAFATEGDDEREQIQHERHDPQQRNRRHVLAEMNRHRREEQRSARGKQHPERSVTRAGRAQDAAGRIADGRIGRGEQRNPAHRHRDRPAHDSEHHEARRERGRLRAQAERRLDEPRIDKQREQRPDVGDREQPIWMGRRRGALVHDRVPDGARVPRLQQRTRGRQRHEREADQQREQPEHAANRMGGFGVQHRIDRQHHLREREREQRDVRAHLSARPELRHEPVRDEIPNEQRALEEHEARRPHRRRSAEERKESFAGDGFDEKEQRAAQKNRDGVPKARMSPASGRHVVIKYAGRARGRAMRPGNGTAS